MSNLDEVKKLQEKISQLEADVKNQSQIYTNAQSNILRLDGALIICREMLAEAEGKTRSEESKKLKQIKKTGEVV